MREILAESLKRIWAHQTCANNRDGIRHFIWNNSVLTADNSDWNITKFSKITKRLCIPVRYLHRIMESCRFFGNIPIYDNVYYKAIEI